MKRLKELELDQVQVEEVRATFIVFGILCASIRLVPILLRKLTS